MFVNEDYDNYKYLVKVSDNYVVLSNSRYIDGTWEEPDTINVIYQYIKPSWLTIKDTYTSTSSVSFKQIDVDSEFTSRADYIDIFIGCTILVILALFVFKQVTRIFVKGGV